MSELLGNYDVKKNLNANVDFKLTFEIPENCSYTTALIEQVNFVKIMLNKGEKDPSPDYVTYDINYGMINNILTVQFEQQDLTEIENLVFVKKPRVIISDAGNLSI